MTARLIATYFPEHKCIDDLKTDRSFDLQLSRSLMCLYFDIDFINGYLYNQANANVRLPVAGIKCQYCTKFSTTSNWLVKTLTE